MDTRIRQEMLEAEDALQAVNDLPLQDTLWQREPTAEARQAEWIKKQTLAAKREDELKKKAFIVTGPTGVRNYDC